MCGTSCASYCTVTGAVRPGSFLVGGAEAICTVAVSLPAVAVKLPIPPPNFGAYVTCSPDVSDSVPSPVTVQVTSSVLLTSTAVNTVGSVIGDARSDGVMVSDGSG